MGIFKNGGFMKEQDLLESFSGINEELLKRSENNKKTN